MLFAIVGSSTVLPSAFVPRPPSNVFHFFHLLFSSSSSCFALFLIFLMFIAIAFVVVAVAVNRIWQHWQRYGEGRWEQSCQAGLGSLGFMATLHCKTGATFSALLGYTPASASAWALHSKAVINNLITDFVSVRHKQH